MTKLVEITRMKLVGVMLVGTVLFASMANALFYTMWIANPVIRSDAWYFLDAFVAKHLDGSLRWTDYFVKREASDHSQPLFKLLLVFNTDWFGLDFFYEAMFGFIGLIVCSFVLIAIALRAVPRQLNMAEVCLVALIPPFLFSLNSMEIYNWSLVILSYTVLPFALVLFSISSRGGGYRRLVLIFLATFICLVVMDNSGVLLCFVVIAALAVEALRGSGWRSAVARMLPIAAALVLYRLTYTLVIGSFPLDRPRSANVMDFFINQGTQIWKAAVFPAAISLVHAEVFLGAFGWMGYAVMIAGGAIVVAFHAMFWLSVFRTPAGSYVTFMAVCLMLFVYSATAGIVLIRVPEYGWDYLLQHRYIVSYQLANIALVLQWLVARNSTVKATGSRIQTYRWHLHRLLPVATLVAVVVIQGGLAVHAWQQGKFLRAYHQGMAQTMFCLASHPEVENPRCQALLSGCGWQPEIRNRLIGILNQHHLNVFSREFQVRHGMQPDPAEKERCLPLIKETEQPLAVTEVVDVRVLKDPETGGPVIVGSIVGTGLKEGDVAIINRNLTVATVFGNRTWSTFSMPLSVMSNQSSFTLQIFRPTTKEYSQPVTVTFKP